jgi:hypothetical protein
VPDADAIELGKRQYLTHFHFLPGLRSGERHEERTLAAERLTIGQQETFCSRSDALGFHVAVRQTERQRGDEPFSAVALRVDERPIRVDRECNPHM